jgi:hypothetical protein
MPLLLAGEAQAPEFNRFTVEYRKPNDAAHRCGSYPLPKCSLG